ncbi:hypothetical protein FF1_009179 [Malus domestica]
MAPAEINPKSGPGAIFILEKASLEVAKVGKTYQLLNSDDHSNFLHKNKKDPALYRPDIVHQKFDFSSTVWPNRISYIAGHFGYEEPFIGRCGSREERPPRDVVSQSE